MKLVTTDEKKTVIAEYHRARYLVNKQKARLEVQPVGVGMLDYIVLTFVVAETMRRERQEAVVSMSTGGLSQIGIWLVTLRHPRTTQ